MEWKTPSGLDIGCFSAVWLSEVSPSLRRWDQTHQVNPVNYRFARKLSENLLKNMGGGGLVILKHKSWHVYNEKNRERVRKDEEKAKKEEDEKKARAAKADQEHRLGVLRSRTSGSRQKDSETDASVNVAEFGGKEGVHVNLFGELESEVCSSLFSPFIYIFNLGNTEVSAEGWTK
ncbi:hypothetical protein BC830DRAFT_469356 [Chytriomyces sp. MP71]|nr:hypothetical protein BC830DRAFT_469356 [Chytriomyces sp. MP71]